MIGLVGSCGDRVIAHDIVIVHSSVCFFVVIPTAGEIRRHIR